MGGSDIEKFDIRLEDLSENHREYARVIGIDALLKLCNAFGGTPIYLPKIEEIRRPALYRQIKKEYLESELSMGAIARKYGVSESTVYRLVKDESCRKSVPGQLNMFD